MAKRFFFWMCACLLTISNSEHGTIKANPVQNPASNSVKPYNASGMFGRLGDPLKPVLEPVNRTLFTLTDSTFDAYRDLLKQIPGSRSGDTKNGAISETLGSDNPSTQLIAGLLSQNNFINVLVNRAIFRAFFGGDVPVNDDGKSLNQNNDNEVFSDLLGNNQKVDGLADRILNHAAGRGYGENENKKLD